MSLVLGGVAEIVAVEGGGGGGSPYQVKLAGLV